MAIFQNIITVLVMSFYYASTMNIQNADADQHIWAPMTSLKSPYVTFINDFNRPTWWTRHALTKKRERLHHLSLPREVPFAVVCGACFQHSILNPNLTISISDHVSQSVPKRRRDRSFQYKVGVNECLMTYMITEPIQKAGTITCTLNRGKQKVTEVISFNVVDVDIQEPPEELEIGASDTGIVLHCPQLDEPFTKNNPAINVWHVENKESSKNSVGFPILSTKSILHLDQPKYTTTIVCSVYNIITPSIVHQTRYKIQGSQTNAKSEYHISNDILRYEEDAEVLSPKMTLSSSVLAIIITAGVVCILLGIVGTYRFIAAARSNH